MQGAGTSAEQLEVSPLHSGVDRNVVGLLGGPGRDRTDDLFHAMEARSQLRHRPTLVGSTTSILAHTYGIVKLRSAHSSSGEEPAMGRAIVAKAAKIGIL